MMKVNETPRALAGDVKTSLRINSVPDPFRSRRL